MISRLWQVVALSGFLPAIAGANSGLIRVTSIRTWSHPGTTRVILQTTGPFEYHSNRAYGPDRLFFDILHSRPWIDGRRYATREIHDALVNRVRIAETAPGTTRIVFDLAGAADFRVTRLDTPDRMVIEIRPEPRRLETPARPAVISGAIPPEPYKPFSYKASRPLLPSPGALRAREGAVSRNDEHPFFVFPPAPALRLVAIESAPPLAPEELAAPPAFFLPQPTLAGTIAHPRYVRAVSTRVMPATRTTGAAMARPPEDAARSLTRTLGLKINRIVIDAGHGGHDDGTIGPHGVMEKDVVLDVALRLAALVQNRMGAEVVLTRSDDTFIPLHERTAIANEHKADLFLSIHANSSPSRAVGGAETFFLNFTNNPTALDVAARENAGSDKSVGDLKDLIQSITLNDKITESQTFARDLQTYLFAQAAKSNAAARDRGVKRAPFVVLIGASMPSALAEIGFLSNARDESNLNKPEYRQKIAEALFRGLAQYAKSLSHFEVASGSLPGTGAGVDRSRY